MTNDFYWRETTYITPNYLYTFYIHLGHWDSMAKDRMIEMLDDQIIPGVCRDKAEKAEMILKHLQST